MRTNAVAVILEVVARMRQLDPRLKVTWEPGWERLGNGLAARYVGGIVHDTTTPSSPAKPFPTQNMLRVGRPDLSGPIANFGGPYCTVDAPWIHVTAAFPANHAGASGGRSMGPLPRTSLFNPTVLGLEIDFSGLALMPAGQMYVGKLWARAVADVLAGGNLEYVRAHFETSVTGKIDISFASGRSYDMAAFRRDAAAILAKPKPKPKPKPTPTPAPLGDLDMHVLRDPNSSIWFWTPISCAQVAGLKSPQVLSGAVQKMLKTGGAELDVITDVSWAELDELVADATARRKELAHAVWTETPPGTGDTFPIHRLIGVDDKTGRLEQAVKLVAAPQGDVSEDMLAEALARPEVAAVIGEALAAAVDRRARDGDPATGPVS